MKKIILILLVSTLTLSCNDSVEPDVSYDDIHNCLPIPDDVPTTYKNGTPIEWDCEMKSFYVNGDLIFHYDVDGNLMMIEKVR